MKTNQLPLRSKKYVPPALIWIIVILMMAFAALVVYRLISNKPLGLRSFINTQIFWISNRGKILTHGSQIKTLSKGDYTNILFLHHSVGSGIINEGNLRQLLTEKGYAFWDQGYSFEGLRDPGGNSLGFTFTVPEDNTDPDGLYALFSQKNYQIPINGLSELLQYEVIVFKSCFPVNNIENEQQMETLKTYYLGIRDTVDQHPDKLFILLTTPPLNPAETNADNASRARAMTQWLKSKEFTGGRENLAVYDLFDLLAEPDLAQPDANMLREDFRAGNDSHPIATGNKTAAQGIADFVDQQVKVFRQNH